MAPFIFPHPLTPSPWQLRPLQFYEHGQGEGVESSKGDGGGKATPIPLWTLSPLSAEAIREQRMTAAERGVRGVRPSIFSAEGGTPPALRVDPLDGLHRGQS